MADNISTQADLSEASQKFMSDEDLAYFSGKVQEEIRNILPDPDFISYVKSGLTE